MPVAIGDDNVLTLAFYIPAFLISLLIAVFSRDIFWGNFLRVSGFPKSDPQLKTLQGREGPVSQKVTHN